VGEHALKEQSREERNRFFARVFLGVSLSIFLHVIVSVATYEASLYFDQPKAKPTVLIDWIEPSQLKKDDWSKVSDQVVRKADLPKDLIDLNLKTKRRFLSEEKQTVKKETRAAASGMTENRESLDLSPSRPASRATTTRMTTSKAQARTNSFARQRLPEVLPNSIFVEGLGDVTIEEKNENSNGDRQSASRELVLPSDPRRNRGVSTTGEQLPSDIQIGDFTALNTDRFMFYTFYARIEEQIRHRWVRYVKAAIFGGGDLREGQNEYVTNLEVVLNREGDFVRAIIHDGSGSRDIDAAPILAFREAKRIPHPPREMVKADGTIRLYYSFHVDQLPPLARAKLPPAEQRDGASRSDGD
jgi:hypothetical protein